MEWLNQDFQVPHFDTQTINETSSSWGLTRRTEQLMGKITLWQPQFLPVLTRPLKSISTIPWYHDSHIWGAWAPPQ